MPPTAEPTAVADDTVDPGPADGQRRRRSVALLATGGTIASAATPDGAGRRAALSPAELLDAVGPLGGVSVEPVIELARINSWDVGPQLMWSIALRVQELAARDDVDGVVVTHGTDPIEETAFVTDIATSTDAPVVFVAGGAGGGVELSRSGACDAGSLSAGKARLLLMACLAGADADAARTRFRAAVDVLGRPEGAAAA